LAYFQTLLRNSLPKIAKVLTKVGGSYQEGLQVNISKRISDQWTLAKLKVSRLAASELPKKTVD
jgi:hypothetical protein